MLNARVASRVKAFEDVGLRAFHRGLLYIDHKDHCGKYGALVKNQQHGLVHWPLGYLPHTAVTCCKTHSAPIGNPSDLRVKGGRA